MRPHKEEMLEKLYSRIDDSSQIKIKKIMGAEDVSSLGALPCGAVVTFVITVPTRLRVDGVILRIRRDGGEDREFVLYSTGKGDGKDVYSYTLDTMELCDNEDSGLYYYEFLFLRGFNTLFTDTHNNVDFSVSPKEGRRFRLLLYKNGFKEMKADDALALKYLQKAADLEFAEAMYDLGIRHEKGQGVPFNSKKAFYWLKKAAQKGHDHARRYLEQIQQ